MEQRSWNKNQVKLYCAYYAQDDPRKNTAIKLKKFNLIRLCDNVKKCPRKGIILDPFSSIEISINDRDLISRHGLIVIDCSWNQISTIFTQPFENGRRLPPLLAANSINYGKWGKLSSAEALGAALYLTGFEEQAINLLSKFRWANEFWRINQDNLNKKD